MSDLPEQIDALLALNAKGAVSHPVPGLAAELLAKAATALRSKPVAGVEVKPLGDWRRGYCDERVQIQQQSFGGLYQVRVLDGVVWLDWPNRTAEEFATVELAKAAAEADYRQRILSTLSLPAQEPVAWRREYADPHYQSEVTQWKETADVWAEDGFTVTPLYASPQPEAVITEEMAERVWLAVLDCPHTITGQEIILRHAVEKEGRNATNQLRKRITAALKDA